MFGKLSKLFDTNEREISRLKPILTRINQLESKFQAFADTDFPAFTAELKLRLSRGETLDDILPEAFAAVREASQRTLGLRHFDVQLLAAMVFHHGQVAEQKTGEGKTLSATAALYLNSLSGRGVHLVTVNDYLAQRDAGWNGPLFHFLGVSVGIIIHDQAFIYDPEFQGPDRDDERLEHLQPVPRKQAYAADITYGTSNEFGFDYLRDNMAQSLESTVQRGHYFAVVDEVDSVLIDEARTPLIISAPDTEPTDKYLRFRDIVNQLAPTDYEIDEKLRTANLTDYGVKKIEKSIGVNNLYENDYDTLHHIEQALKARTLFNRDKEYVVKDNQIIIVDEHTGRLMFGRRYSDGLHQAIEAKESVPIQRESKTLATVSLQNYFRMYEKLAGMTGTAATEAEEFSKIYRMEVVVIPTHRPVKRIDYSDLVYKTTRAKYAAIVKEVAEKFSTGQPVLLGTRSIQHNEIISKYLKRKKIPHQVLNAKNHEKEAHIIANAGKLAAVTVATNIAGRGVDIVLGGSPPDRPHKNASKTLIQQYQQQLSKWQENHQKVLETGGLHVIGTERHESRRIDNQLRGRSGRQGDPGSSRFFVALDDEIMRIFGGEQVARLMTALKIPEDQPIEAGLVSRSIANAQSKVEGFHFDQRKHLVDYDDVLNKQREIIYQRRRRILESNPDTDVAYLHQRLEDIMRKEVELLVSARSGQGFTLEEADAIAKEFSSIIPLESSAINSLRKSILSQTDVSAIITSLNQTITKAIKVRNAELGQTEMAGLIRFTLLKTIDDLWIHHLDSIEDLRQGIWLRGSQETALAEYKKEAFDLFESLIATTNSQVARRIFRVQVVRVDSPSADLSQIEAKQPAQIQVPIDAGIDQDQNPFAAALARSSQKPIIKDTGRKNTQKVGRNDPCPCGAVDPNTGKIFKFKKCGLIGAPHHQG